ncbi:mRNA (2'-O-methyladenosine-N(6)-)-methyltransferase [Malassezia sp. CBS 17886]|nr:mRNA (2'-O-methyladenosine-N(6)-)-methyltransferase [Malassezia sp. CBS 17886]
MDDTTTLPPHAVIADRYLKRPTAKSRILADVVCRFVVHVRAHREFHSTDNRFRPFCPYLNACHRKSVCKFLHFTIDATEPHAPFQCTSAAPCSAALEDAHVAPVLEPARQLHRCGLGRWLRSPRDGVQQRPAQWIDCDVRTFDFATLGKFDVIVADPPRLPYGTLSDEEMYALPVPTLQDEGLIFLWVTGRAMEVGRALLQHWGYMRVDELVWVKIGQTQRLIRSGRTGHWLNHTKEHCLVGLKTKQGPTAPTAAPGAYIPRPAWLHAGLGTDVIVAQVRDTSQKPDELVAMIEKMCPGGRKIELFGRQHNIRPGWLTLGNQLKSTHVGAEEQTPLLHDDAGTNVERMDVSAVNFPKPTIDNILHALRSEQLPITMSPKSVATSMGSILTLARKSPLESPSDAPAPGLLTHSPRPQAPPDAGKDRRAPD